MSEELTVVRVLDDNAKSGVSAKTNKPWSMSKVELSNGEGVFIFNPIEQGERVVGEKRGDYMNYSRVRPDPKHEEVMKALRALYSQQATILSILRDGAEPEPKPAQKAPEKAKDADIVRDWEKVGKKEDVVHPMTDEEPINLDDIPF